MNHQSSVNVFLLAMRDYKHFPSKASLFTTCHPLHRLIQSIIIFFPFGRIICLETFLTTFHPAKPALIRKHYSAWNNNGINPSSFSTPFDTLDFFFVSLMRNSNQRNPRHLEVSFRMDQFISIVHNNITNNNAIDIIICPIFHYFF
jgi:hypothetical protein